MSVRSASEFRFPDKQVIINFIKRDESLDKDLNKIAEEGGCGPNSVEKVAAYFANRRIRPIEFARNVSIALQGFQDEEEFERLLSASAEYPSGQEMSEGQLQAAVTALREKANKARAEVYPNEKVREAVCKFTWAIEDLYGQCRNRIPQGEKKFYSYQRQSLNQ